MFNLALWGRTGGHQIHMTAALASAALTLLWAGLSYSRFLRAFSRLDLNTSKDGGGTVSPGPLIPKWNLPFSCRFEDSLARTCDLCLILLRWPWAEGYWDHPGAAVRQGWHRAQEVVTAPALMAHLEVSHPSPFKGRWQKTSTDESYCFKHPPPPIHYRLAQTMRQDFKVSIIKTTTLNKSQNCSNFRLYHL